MPPTRSALAALLALLALVGALPSAAAPAGGPMVFAPRGQSTDRFAVDEAPEVVEVSAHDGVVLHSRVFRPATDERVPVILVHSPYYDGVLLGDPERSMDLVRYFTPKGYAVVLSDVRGTGNSGGCGEQDGPNQARDFRTLVEHFADAPWSNGRVGSYGKSYDAETQHAGAVLDPEGLVTMVSVAGISGLYDVANFDGVPLRLNGVLSAAAYELYDLDVPGEVGAMPRRFERHTCQPANFAAGADPSGDMTDYFAEREFRARVGEVTASTLYVTGLDDFTVSPINLDGWFDELPTFKRAIIGQWAHRYPYDAPDRYARDDWYDTVHAWFDHELLGLDTGVEAWPQVQVQDEEGGWRAVDSFRGMGTEAVLPVGTGTATFTETGSWSVDLDAPARHLSGQAYLDAVIALDRPDGHLAVRLDEVRADGSTRQLVRGYLSTVHRESLLRQVPVTPGHPTPYRIRTYPFDATLDEGSRLRLVVAGFDAVTTPAGTGYTATIDLDRTVLRVPVADDRCGLAVARRVDGADPRPCPGGVPASRPWTEVPRTAGHTTTARLVGSTATTVGGVAAVREWGYLTMRDGVELAFEVVRPADDRRHPTLLTYDGYDAGANPDPGYAARYLPRGYALVGLNLRGTGCSGGTFDFFQPAEAWDGHEAVEWAAAQGWSTGRVGMIGKSYPGITQLFTAATRPPHLAAIAPGHHYADVYRDIANPGGILNVAFASLWSFVAQPSPGYAAAAQDGPAGLLAGDPTCAAHQAHAATNAPTTPLLQAETHPYEVLLHAERSPLTTAERIEVPVYQALSWQDEQLMSRNTHLLSVLERNGTPYRAVLSNGDHGTYREEPQMAQL
jgi:predicted acyl esterase